MKNEESKDITVYKEYDERPLKISDIRAQVNLIQELMKVIMQEGQHYGKIAGSDKPTLLKPGAEKIMTTFRLAADPEIEDLSTNDILRYRVKCKLYTQVGNFKGAGVGECSSEEEKYKWRKAVSEKEFEATPETHRRIKYRWDNKEEKQVRTNPYDLANTILKMAKKRALVDAVLTITAASDIFTQDIEDLPEEIIDTKKPKNATQKLPQKHEEEQQTIITTIETTSYKEGKKDNRSWILYGIKTTHGWINTFDKNYYQIANENIGKEAKIIFNEIDKSKNLIDMEIMEEINEGENDNNE